VGSGFVEELDLKNGTTRDGNKVAASRELDDTYEVTREEETGGLDINLSVNTDWILGGQKVKKSENGKPIRDENGNIVMERTSGLEEIGNDLNAIGGLVYTDEDGLGGNTKGALDNGVRAGVNLGSSVLENVTGKGKDGIVEDFLGKTRNQELGLQSKRDAMLKESIKGIADNPEGAEEQLEKVANMAVLANGINDGDVDVEFYHAEDGTMGGQKDGKIYINLAYQDGSREKMMEVLGDELSHYVDYKQGRVRPRSQLNNSAGDISRQYGDDAVNQTKGYIGAEDVDAQAFQGSLKNIDFSQINQEVAGTEGMDRRLYMIGNKIVATDGVNNNEIVELTEKGFKELKDSLYEDSVYGDIQKMMTEELGLEAPLSKQMPGKVMVMKVEEGLEVEGEVYNVGDRNDFDKLLKKAEVNYVMLEEGGEKYMLYYQNGIQNSYEDALSGAEFTRKITGAKEVGVINNPTSGPGAGGIVGDLSEYTSNEYDLRDAMTAKVYEDISKNGDSENTIVMFSAGNKDAKRALEVLAMEGRSLNDNVNFISVGSPVSEADLEKSMSKVDAKLVGQYNDWKDPVANSMGWVSGTGGLALVGGVSGAAVGASVASGAGPMAAYGGALIGGGIGGGSLLYSLFKNHSYQSYIEKDTKGVQEALREAASPTQEEY